MLLLLFSSPLLAALASLFSRLLGTPGVSLVSRSLIGFGFLLSCLNLYEVWWCASPVYLSCGDWFVVNQLTTTLTLGLDPLSSGMAFTVIAVSCGVHFYSIWYLEGDPHLPRFTFYIGLFTFLMLVLSMSVGLAMAFVGWEGIGVVSYLLIAYWMSRAAAVQSAVQAFLLNRVGDWALTLVLAVAFSSFGSISWFSLTSASEAISEQSLELIGLLVLAAAAGKSAQLGLQAWLPNAMEAPTPVSALIHAATLVTAGVLLLIRCASVLEASSGSALIVMALLGALTSVFAGITGLRQTDFKRVIAFSTCSQVAFIVLGCGTGQFTAAFVLLMMHAFYKATLFLGAGAVIHAIGGLQDIRLMGGLGRVLPFTSTLMLLAIAALGAAPYTSGDFAKDVLIENHLGGFIVLHNLTWALAVFSAGLTLYYSGRLHRLAFEGETRAPSVTIAGVHEPTSTPVIIVLAVLGTASVCIGWFLSEFFSTNSGALGLIESPSTNSPLDTEYSSSALLVLLPLIASGLGLSIGVTGISVSADRKPHRRASYLFGVLSQTKWGFDSILSQAFSRSGLGAAYVSYKYLDRGLLEAIGPQGLSSSLLALAASSMNIGRASIGELVLITTTSAVVMSTLAYTGDSVSTVLLVLAGFALAL